MPGLIAIPMFTFAGYLLGESGTPKRLVRLSLALLGWLPGGLAIVAIVACAFFTAFTGASGVTIVAHRGISLPGADAKPTIRATTAWAWSPPPARSACCSRPRCR